VTRFEAPRKRVCISRLVGGASVTLHVETEGGLLARGAPMLVPDAELDALVLEPDNPLAGLVAGECAIAVDSSQDDGIYGVTVATAGAATCPTIWEAPLEDVLDGCLAFCAREWRRADEDVRSGRTGRLH